MTDVELAWLAGLLEGEGTFSITYQNGPNSPRCPRIGLAMCDRDVVERAADLMGGKRVSDKPVKQTDKGNPRKPQYAVALYTAQSIEMMKQLLPLMGERRSARIRELITIYYAERPHLQENK